MLALDWVLAWTWYLLDAPLTPWELNNVYDGRRHTGVKRGIRLFVSPVCVCRPPTWTIAQARIRTLHLRIFRGRKETLGPPAGGSFFEAVSRATPRALRRQRVRMHNVSRHCLSCQPGPRAVAVIDRHSTGTINVSKGQLSLAQKASLILFYAIRASPWHRYWSSSCRTHPAAGPSAAGFSQSQTEPDGKPRAVQDGR